MPLAGRPNAEEPEAPDRVAEQLRQPQERRGRLNRQFDFKSARSKEFSLQIMRENSEIINLDSTPHVMSSNTIFVEDLASKEKIVFSGKSRRDKRTKGKSRGKLTSQEDLIRESINFNKNLLILKKSLQYISKFEDSDAEEDAALVPTPTTTNLASSKRGLKSTSNFNSKIERELSILRTFDRDKSHGRLETRGTGSGARHPGEPRAQKGISVYRVSQRMVSSRQLGCEIPTQVSRRMETGEKANTLEENLRQGGPKEESKPRNVLEKNVDSSVEKPKKKEPKTRSQSKKKSTRKFSIFDKLSRKKSRQEALERHLRQKQEQELKECTFKPSINQVSRMICSFKELETGKGSRGRV